ncbi:MAG TPA: phenylalanine--tRNA ligase subunit beta, partial [Solirubrobacteraceae bacterium]
PPLTLRLRDARVSGLLGAAIPRERSAEILRALEFGVADSGDGLVVSVPYFRRADVTREADLIEEVARLDGFEKLPATLPSRHGAAGRLTPRQRLRRRAADALTAQGLHESVGWSFVAPDLADRLRLAPDDVRRRAIELENPMSADQSHMRTTLLGSLLDAARYNRARGAGSVRLFESGPVYVESAGADSIGSSAGAERPGESAAALPSEPHHLGALLTGPVRPATWRDPGPRAADFSAAKGAMTGLLQTLRVPFAVEAASEPFLHPGRSAAVLLEGERIGWLGEIHPLVAGAWDLDGIVGGFELDLDAVTDAAVAAGVPMHESVPSFPDVREDLAVIVPEGIAASEVLAVVRRAGGSLLAAAEVFDVYRDAERIGAGKVSLALRLSFRGADRTLTDEEVAGRRDAIALALEGELGGSIRAA